MKRYFCSKVYYYFFRYSVNVLFVFFMCSGIIGLLIGDIFLAGMGFVMSVFWVVFASPTTKLSLFSRIAVDEEEDERLFHLKQGKEMFSFGIGDIESIKYSVMTGSEKGTDYLLLLSIS